MTQPALELRDLIKTYSGGFGRGGYLAVDHVDLVVSKGDGVALVGPNGAGKSTLLMLAAGLRHPTSGTVRVFGRDPRQVEVRRTIGVLPDRPALCPDLTIEQHLHLTSAAFGLPEPEVRVAELMGRMDLSPARHGVVGTLSAGLQKRVALALALLPSPKLLLLDEPLSALDPASVRLVTTALAEERAAGATMVITTHRLAELVGCCDRVVHVVQGAVERLGATEHVLVRMPVRVIFSLPPGARLPAVGAPEPAPPGVWIRVAPATRRDALVEQVRAAGGAVLSVSPMLDLLTSGKALDVEETLA
jgi:ABC-type multidrug transport system ATPase subunit